MTPRRCASLRGDLGMVGPSQLRLVRALGGLDGSCGREGLLLGSRCSCVASSRSICERPAHFSPPAAPYVALWRRQSLLHPRSIVVVHMDQCTRGALRLRSDQDLVGPKISITVRTPMIDPLRCTKEARMEHEQRKTGCSDDGQSLDDQSSATSAGDGAQPEPDPEKPRQFQQGSASGEQDARPESVPAIEFSYEGRAVRNRCQGRSDMVRRRRRLRGSGTFRREQSRLSTRR